MINIVQLHEQIFRDAHQSKLATRMRTDDMLPICETIDQVGYFSMEVWGGATFDAPMRFLAEDPWERLKTLREHLPNTPLQMLERAMNIVAYHNFPDDIVEKFIEYAYKDGCTHFRIFDALNDLRNLEKPIEVVKEVGGHAQGCVSYTISPVHTVEMYMQHLKELQKMGCDSLCIKDMAGMITPAKVHQIISQSIDEGVKIPIDLHCHATSGMAMMSYMKACDAGVSILDTSISPFSGGTGQPPTESVVLALKGTEYDTGYDIDLLMECREYFLKVWDKYSHLHRPATMMVDPSVMVHQIPGGMLSNLLSQLEQQDAADKYQEVLEEIPRVRADLGYPPLVTPTSQIVGTQAVMNIIAGERYKIVTNETKEYVRGMYGKPPGEVSEEIHEKILGPDWKDEVINVRPADLLEPRFKKCNEELEELGLLKKPEDVITYAIYPELALKFFRGEIKPEFTSDMLPLKPRTGVAASGPGAQFRVTLGGEAYDVNVKQTGGELLMDRVAEAPAHKAAVSKAEVPTKREITSPMQGTILHVHVEKGDKVSEGDVLAILEAMKMENEITAPSSGVVKAVYVEEGQTVNVGAPLFIIG